MRNMNRYTGWMMRGLLGAAMLALAGAAAAQTRLTLSDLQAQIRAQNLKLEEVGETTVRFNDRGVGLMWQKTLPVHVAKCASSVMSERDVRCANRDYRWTSREYGQNADGDLYTVFLSTLNTAPCFAGHCDWRIPTEVELRSILDYLGQPGECKSRPCIDQNLYGALDINPTSNAFVNYWTSDADRYDLGSVFTVDFLEGGNTTETFWTAIRARAVRDVR